MKCLVFSDAHGDTSRMASAIALHPDASTVFFLGDGLWQAKPFFESYPELARIIVSGNCDVSFSLPDDEEAFVDLGGVRVLAFHGHRYGVKYGVSAAALEAARRGADVLLFGHTHIPMTDCRETADGRPLWIMNPGAVRDGSYGILEIKDGVPSLSLASI